MFSPCVSAQLVKGKRQYVSTKLVYAMQFYDLKIMNGVFKTPTETNGMSRKENTEFMP